MSERVIPSLFNAKERTMNIKDLKEKLKTFLEGLGYELYDLEYNKTPKRSVLTVFIDSDHNITIDDCVDVTHELNPYLDELDPIVEEYFLEVSSPGAEKELRNPKAIERAIGKFVHVETYEQTIEGYLDRFNGNEIVLKIRNKPVTLNYEEVNHIRLAIKF